MPLSEGIVGKPVPPQDLPLKVTGTAQYTFDIELPGMLYAKLVTSTEPHAIIKKIDTERASSVEGVLHIFTGKDMPYRVGMYAGDRDLLAVEKVRWVGHPVAIVVAEDMHAAEKAAEMVEVEYEPLKAVFDPLEALKDDAPILHERMDEYRHAPAFNPVPGTNIANKFTLIHGDVEKGFRESDIIIEDEFRISHVSHAYMETQNVIAHYMRDGTVEVWTSCQSPFIVRQILSESLGIPYNKVVVKTPFVGGGFGGKAGLGWEALVAVTSKLSGFKPVKLVLSRKENFSSSASREAVIASVKAGFTRDGRCIAYKVRFVLDAGAYADYTVNVSRAMGYSAEGVYEIPNVYCESLAVYTNKIPTTAMRGFGYPESNWVLEQVFERAAAKIGIDSARIRRINLLRPGESHTATGERLREDVGDPRKVLQSLLQQIGWGTKLEPPSKPWRVRSRGFALCVKGPSQPPNSSSSAIIKFNEDSTIDVVIGTGNFGQGTVTSIAQLVADQFGLPIEKVRVDMVRDTSKSAYTWQTVGSRGLFTDGVAVLRACEDAKNQIRRIASQVFRVHEEDLEIVEGKIRVKGRPWISVPLKDVVFGYVYPNGNTVGGPIIGRGYFASTLNTYLDPQTGQGIPTIFHTFGGTGVEVELDPLTGEIEVIKAVQVFDVGKAINPLLLKMQLEGGFIMGMSIALYEKIKFDEQGNILNPNFTGYYIARAKDIPESFSCSFVETPQFDGPMGARGIGELSMISVASAISNAIFLATGVKINNLPMSPEDVWKEICRQRPDLIERAKEEITKQLQEAKVK
jgi:CO/xanthine dehydrogenase Mo-binding subunit